MAASFKGHVDVISALIAAGADIHSQKKVWYSYPPAYMVITPYTPTQGGWTALHLSAQEGHYHVVDVLIEANAHVNQQTKVWHIYVVHVDY